MDSFVCENFICTAHVDVFAVIVPADIYFVTRHTIEVCERALDGLAIDVSRVHESQLTACPIATLADAEITHRKC